VQPEFEIAALDLVLGGDAFAEQLERTAVS
jgi:hypothetical protein